MSINTCGDCGATYPSGIEHTCKSTIDMSAAKEVASRVLRESGMPHSITLESDPFTRVPCACKSATTGTESSIPVWTQAEVDNLRDVQGYPPEVTALREPWHTADAMIAEAVRVTSTDRHDLYAPPEDNFSRIAAVWSGLLDGKLTKPVTAGDVARCMAGMKLVRDAHKPQRDNRVDCVGYIRCLERAEPTDD